MTLQVVDPAVLKPAEPALIDPFGRAITYLRVSVTDRCDFRCVYCMAENMTFLPKAEVLTTTGYPQLDMIASKHVMGWIFEPKERLAPGGDEWCDVEVVLKTGN